MRILGIETSCDETSAAVVDDQNLLSNVIATQHIHKDYGGVVPEFASRAHLRQLPLLIRAALDEAKLGFDDIDGLAVTYGPGLAGSLLVGLSLCKSLALSLNRPWIGINHLEGHIMAPAANDASLSYPFLGLVVSGGHTLLVHVPEPLTYRIIGRTIDDAAGEAFDKVAKILNLGYPGGPAVEKAARTGEPKAINLPRALLDQDHLDFSFSGLKTAVLYYAQSLNAKERQSQQADIAASFQQAVVDVLIQKSLRALDRTQCRTLVLAGGVARNTPLRTAFAEACQRRGTTLLVPDPELCTDNAGMIARIGHLRLTRGQASDNDLDVVPNLSLA